jgi:hypothetical protein
MGRAGIMTDEATGSAPTGIFGGERQVNQMAEDAKKLLGEAKAGKWAVDEETGAHLRRGVARMLDRLSEISLRMDRLQRAPKLGNDAYAKTVAQHFLAAMTADDQALVRVFENVRNSVDVFGEAIDEAIKHYDASDEVATMHFGSLED